MALIQSTDRQLPLHRVLIGLKGCFVDPQGNHLIQAISDFLHIKLEEVRVINIYTIRKELSAKQLEYITEQGLSDAVLETSYDEKSLGKEYDWSIEISLKKGMTDNPGKTARTTIEDLLDAAFGEEEDVFASQLYLFKGDLHRDHMEWIAYELLGNPLIQDITIRSFEIGSQVEFLDLAVSDSCLGILSRQRQLALNLVEMKKIQEYFYSEETIGKRSARSLPAHPTDVEIEALAQSWSEHCKHKIFNALIHYKEDGKEEEICSLFKSYIRKATEDLSSQKDWLVSVFTDNAGIVKFNSEYNLAFKVETHNSPSALDPYGGSLTGILGVNRDILGAGLGARLMANTDIFCFAEPSYSKKLPPRIQHPKRVYEGVRRGVEHGGNKLGVPTVNGAVVFDESYLGKPLVYCGTLGILPAKLHGKATEVKEILSGDLIIVAGGRTGRDGIHGATFSSEELRADSPSSAVQIGDPFTQRKLHDFLLEARDRGLYRTLTDNGAGGLSSSVGELAQLSNGCELHLDRVPLKQAEMAPWEILVSESQERMTLAAAPEHLGALKQLARAHEVEIACVGQFIDNGYFHILHEGATVGYIELHFLHHGVPQLELEAEWVQQQEGAFAPPASSHLREDLHRLLARYNICSKESLVRQYDHEVQGGSAIKPFVGAESDGPSDAAIVRPMEALHMGSKEAVVLANGICPKYSRIDTYHMAACAVDEAIRNCVAVGCDPATIAILDNFCWPDPIYHPIKTPDGKFKLAQLVRANQALYDCALGFQTPIISGKDSMKNDYKDGTISISILPTLLISAVGKISDVEKAVTMDVKYPGDKVYVVGKTKRELGATEYSLMVGEGAGAVPKVDILSAGETYKKIHWAIQEELIASCHDCSDGGLGVALAESAMAGGYGLDIDLAALPCEGDLSDTEKFFSESPSRFVLTVAPSQVEAFEKTMEGTVFACIGEVRADDRFLVMDRARKTELLASTTGDLKRSWKGGLA